PSIYVLILTGTKKSFIAGADIKEWNSLTSVEAVEWSGRIQKTNSRLESFRIPVIAAVNGYALGGGNELAMSCDIRIASSKAKFGQPEVGLGVIAGAGGTQRIQRLVGVSMAKELLYTGRTISAKEAERIGLVSRVTEPEELMPAALELAREICLNAQIAVQETKRAVNLDLRTDIDTGLAAESQAFGICIGTEDKKIGATAFINKSMTKNFIYQ
ncbi:MAG: enoyl-CoA hydratase/isomerase family protein, partial [Lachnospiraceae bacterium]|nr:enoyl-CoA hydratase/isomerase family protein [Lachnospiraceae bacterium]